MRSAAVASRNYYQLHPSHFSFFINYLLLSFRFLFMTKFIHGLLALLFVSMYGTAQDANVFKPDSVRKEMTAMPIISLLKIDGKLDEKEWGLARSSPRFIQIEPLQGSSPNFETEVKVLYNRQYLYFGIFCSDSVGKKAIRATDFKRDFNFRQHDHIGLSFDGFNDHRNSMALFVNAYGVQRDLLNFDDVYTDIDWDGLWKVRTTRTDSGWYAEIAVPWQTLRYPKTKDSIQQWGFNAYRIRRLSNETSAFSPYPRSFTFMRMDYSGILQNLRPPPPKPNIRIQPYVLTSYDKYNGFASSVDPEKTNFRAGGDVKWAINPNTVLDLTFNTDFAQADADRQVNNVTRFSVFFPERRQFFLENASLFGPGAGPSDDLSGGNMRIRPFFSRAIGLDDSGNPIPIEGGGRFVYRSSKKNFGALVMRQQGSDNMPATNFFVGRYLQNLGRQNRIGALVTVKDNKDGNNIVSALDGFFRLGESHQMNTMLIHSTTSSTGKQGFAGFAQYYYITNQWRFWWTESFVTKNFNPELGFVSRNDVIGTTPGVFWYYRGKKLPFPKLIRAFEPGAWMEMYHQASTGKLTERQISLNPVWLNFSKGGYFGYIIAHNFQRLTEIFSPLGIDILPGDYSYVNHQIYYSTDPSRQVSTGFDYGWGKYFNGRLNNGNFRLQIAPVPHFSVLGQYNLNRFKNVGEPAASKTVSLYSISGRLALNPALQMIGFYQKNSENNLSNYNIRLSWEYQPLSYFYIVFNHRGFDNLPDQRQTEDHAIIKISYLKQL